MQQRGKLSPVSEGPGQFYCIRLGTFPQKRLGRIIPLRKMEVSTCFLLVYPILRVPFHWRKIFLSMLSRATTLNPN